MIKNSLANSIILVLLRKIPDHRSLSKSIYELSFIKNLAFIFVLLFSVVSHSESYPAAVFYSQSFNDVDCSNTNLQTTRTCLHDQFDLILQNTYAAIPNTVYTKFSDTLVKNRYYFYTQTAKTSVNFPPPNSQYSFVPSSDFTINVIHSCGTDATLSINEFPASGNEIPFTATCTVNCTQGKVFNINTNSCVNPPDNPKSTGLSCPATAKSISFNAGNEFIREQDYFAIGFAAPYFNRTYNSTTAASSSYSGKRWSNELNRSVVNSIDYSYVYRPDGKVYTFYKVGSSWLVDADITDRLIELKDVNDVRIGWQYIAASDNSIEIYNLDGLLESITDKAGNTVTYTLSTTTTPATIALSPNLPMTMTNQLGQSLRFTYDASSRIKAMVNPAGGVYTYAYDTNNNLTSVTYPDGKVKTYLYGSTAGESGNVSSTPEAGVVYTNSLTGVIDENGDRYATYIYDSKGRATSEYLAGNADAASLVFNTDGSGNPTTTQVTDSRGNINTYNFTTILGVVKSTGQSQPAGSGCAASASAITYDANGNVASRTDFNGNMTTFSYDMARNLETRRTEALNTAGNATPATRTITTTWHPTWRLPLVTSEFSGATATGTALRRTTNVYDAKGNITSIAEADPVRSLTRTTTITYTYSSLVPGLVISKVVNGPRTDATDTTTYNYYDANATCTPSSAAPLIDPITNTSPPNLGCRGQLQSMTNALGQTTIYDRYNHHGQVEQMTDANGLVTTNTYDLRQRLLSRTVGTQTTSLTYDNAGQVIQLTMPDSSQLNYTYDAAHRLTEVQDTLGNKVTYTLDSEGNRINEVTTDPLGNLAKTITRSYDALNRLQQVTGVE